MIRVITPSIEWGLEGVLSPLEYHCGYNLTWEFLIHVIMIQIAHFKNSIFFFIALLLDKIYNIKAQFKIRLDHVKIKRNENRFWGNLTPFFHSDVSRNTSHNFTIKSPGFYRLSFLLWLYVTVCSTTWILTPASAVVWNAKSPYFFFF